MKKTLTLLLFVVLAPMLAMAQGCITIFSEDGDRFYLVLNGIRQNNDPQTNVHVDGLPNDFYSAKILFEDQSKKAITQNLPTKDVGSGQFVDNTFKIKRTKSGELKLRYFGSTPVPVNYTPAPDMFVIHFGQALPPTTTSVTTTTHTTTVNNNNPANANMSINAGGVNMNVNVSDPTNGGGLNMSVNMNDGGMNTNVNHSTTSSYTTTTTTNSGLASDGGNYPNGKPSYQATTNCRYPMDMNSFNAAKQTISKTSFEETKLSTAKSILSANCVSTDQVVAICKLFSFEESKLDFAKYAYSKTTDTNNYFKVNNVFSFDASKTELNEFIGH